MNRRRFLSKLAQLTAIAVGGLQACASRLQVGRREMDVFRPPAPDLLTASEANIGDRIRAAFPYLKLDPKGVAAFARDFVANRETVFGKSFFIGLEDRFLLSSSFFDDGADESKVVEYIAFHDPYVTPCSNRLARLVPEPAEEEWWPTASGHQR